MGDELYITPRIIFESSSIFGDLRDNLRDIREISWLVWWASSLHQQHGASGENSFAGGISKKPIMSTI